MITVDACNIVNVDTGARLWIGGWRWCVHDHDRPWMVSRARAQQLIADPPPRWRGDRATIVDMPRCGCCGALASRDLATIYPVILTEVRPGDHRCGRHLGRVPCCIDGCGRTYDMGAVGYDQVVICGQHWREAPKAMRDAVARVRRIARRRGWTDTICARHGRLWSRAVRAVREGRRLDEAEINAMFGWAA